MKVRGERRGSEVHGGCYMEAEEHSKKEFHETYITGPLSSGCAQIIFGE